MTTHDSECKKNKTCTIHVDSEKKVNIKKPPSFIWKYITIVEDNEPHYNMEKRNLLKIYLFLRSGADSIF